jgi:DNA-binding NarL/FixJ family response regulator
MVAVANPALRAGLRSLLAADERLEVVAEARDLSGWPELAHALDVLVLASPDDPQAALAALPQDLSAEPFPAVLLLSDDPGAGLLSQLGLPAWGLLPLEATAEELSAAVAALGQGLLVGASHLVQPLISTPRRPAPALQIHSGDLDPSLQALETLTARESEVLQLLAQGLANKQIAVALGISEHTVKFHVSAIYAKLGAASRTEAVSLAARRGLLVL